MSKHICEFPNCSSETGEHKFCQPHHFWVRRNNLCQACLKPKVPQDPKNPDDPAFIHPLCTECFAVQRDRVRQQKRQEAIDAGLCTNFWMCKEPATRNGGMCDQCFHEYKKRQGVYVRQVTKPSTPVTPVVPVVPKVLTPADFPTFTDKKTETKKIKSVWDQGAPKAVPEILETTEVAQVPVEKKH